MRKTLSTIVLALGLVLAAVPMGGAANAASSTDCSAGQSVDASGCYPTPDCSPTVNRLGYEVADLQERLAMTEAVSQHRLTRIHRQARLIHRLRVRLAKG